ncbi:hypothetical protein [Allocoleopsis sp.]|uniref:hypothetical protein n=1 Tax=Allocoleopsis sp. TaxID=3088169 RepID=UPI002FD14F10
MIKIDCIFMLLRSDTQKETVSNERPGWLLYRVNDEQPRSGKSNFLPLLVSTAMLNFKSNLAIKPSADYQAL